MLTTTESYKRDNKNKMHKINLRTLRISLKYRPEILKLILKMRLCIQRKNTMIKKLKTDLEKMKSSINSVNEKTQYSLVTMLSNCIDGDIDEQPFADNKTSIILRKDPSAHTENLNELKESTKVMNEPDSNEINENQTNIKNTNSSSQTEIMDESKESMNVINESYNKEIISKNHTSIQLTKHSSTQTEKFDGVKEPIKLINESDSKEINTDPENTGWDLKSNKGEKSIAEKVKEVAQSALQEAGMVYVESAGMYYDYKTGYYYNSELGLYYHTDTGCYYYYSDEKQSFVFHSYPDRSAENTALAAHEKKKAKKHKKERNNEVDIDNLTKNMSQGEEDEKPSKPKRRKEVKKKSPQKPKTDVENTEKNNLPGETAKNQDTLIETPLEKKEECSEKEHSEEEKKENPTDLELEDGECSETESDESSDETCKSIASTSTASDDECVAKHHPPSMRVIVRETNLTKLKVGNLFLITKDGGTIGREGEHHAIIINEHGVSRNHLDIKYDVARKTYVATDLGSKNGTILNGIRMSESQDISLPMEVMHGSTIQLGETKLLCHIHPGNDTCGHCEPGLIMDTQEKHKAAYTRTCSVKKQHELELARLKNKYAPKPLMIDSVAYNDRAQARRDTVGSTHHAEKTQSSDLDTFIPAENKGFKLLEKMGWSKGEGLGKDNQGDTEPIPLVSNEGTTGLGSSATIAPQPLPMNRTKNSLGPATLRLASKTKMLNKPAKAFQVDEEELYE